MLATSEDWKKGFKQPTSQPSFRPNIGLKNVYKLHKWLWIFQSNGKISYSLNRNILSSIATQWLEQLPDLFPQ